jgi:hypothetical protein
MSTARKHWTAAAEELGERESAGSLPGERRAPVELTSEQESALLEAIAEADRGEVVSEDELFAMLAQV